MAKIGDILDIEKDRTDNNKWNIIHLFKEGGFYRAYEWSAWLIVTFSYTDDVRKESKDRKPLAVSRKKINKSDNDFTFVGFPLKSLEKFIPNSLNFTPITDTQIDIAINIPVDNDFDTLSNMFEEWKNNIKIQDTKKKHEKEVSDDIIIKPHTITYIMSQVLSYPLEQKTPIENMEFISLLKQQLAAIL